MTVWLQLVSTLAAAVIGGVVAPQLTQVKERRAARAEVRQKLADVELLRWVDEPYEDFRRAIAVLEASAIIAGVPWKLTTAYVRAAEKARAESQAYDEGPDGEPITLVDTRTNQIVVDELETLSLSLWHPWMSRLKRTGSKSKDQTTDLVARAT